VSARGRRLKSATGKGERRIVHAVYGDLRNGLLMRSHTVQRGICSTTNLMNFSRDGRKILRPLVLSDGLLLISRLS
jgi:hypothetical protein